MTWVRQEFEQRIRELDTLPFEYVEDILVRLAHNSSAIEGNTLSISDTVTLLLDQVTPQAGSSMREIYEVENHREAVAIIFEALAGNTPLTTQLALQFHAALMDHLVPDKGKFKTSDNAVMGASWMPVPPSQVAARMREWADQTEWQTTNLNDESLLDAIAGSHIRFERIHPFSDGNGRTGRSILAYQTLRRFGVPAIVPVSERSRYITLLDDDDAPGFALMLAELLAAELDRAVRFTNRGQ
jgi:Fic family protein